MKCSAVEVVLRSSLGHNVVLISVEYGMDVNKASRACLAGWHEEG